MKDWVEIGVFAPVEKGKESGKLLYLQKHLIISGQQTILLKVEGKPFKVGIDPHHLLIDWDVKDNYKVIKSEP